MKLYYGQGACSLAPHLILEELGIPYEAIQVSFDQGDSEKPEFLKLNPMGAVPVLVLDDGKPLTEGLAILTYLADLKKEARLAPPAGTVERARCLEWLSFGATEVHKAFGLIFGAERFGPNPTTIDDVRKKSRDTVSRLFDLIEAKLRDSGAKLRDSGAKLRDGEAKLQREGYALGADYSIADAQLFVFFSWAKHLKFDTAKWPKYGALAARIAERPASLKVLKDEDLLD